MKVVLILFVFTLLFFLFKRIYRLVQKLNIKNSFLSWSISFTPIVAFLIFFFKNFINGLIVLLHFFVFLLLFDLLGFIIKKVVKKRFGSFARLVLAFIVTFLYLSYGYYLAHHVVETHYVIKTTKDIGVDRFKIVQITDSHIGSTMDGDRFISYMERINKTSPDVVVITGDYIDDDTSKEDMIKACSGLGQLKTKYGVYFVFGNHDKGYFNYRGYNESDLRLELIKNHVVLLEDQSIDLLENLTLIGRQDAQTKNRMSAQELTQDLDEQKYSLVLDHEPNDYTQESEAGMDLVLSGHTHGGQLLPMKYISKLFNIDDQSYGLQKRKNTTFLVSSGIGNWTIQFKTGTVAEYVVIDLINKK